MSTGDTEKIQQREGNEKIPEAGKEASSSLVSKSPPQSQTQPQAAPSEPQPITGLTEGRIVHFVTSIGTILPAIVVNAWGGKQQYANLLVFPDGSNSFEDFKGETWVRSQDVPPYPQYNGSLIWRTSCYFKPDQDSNGLWEKNSWHWPPRA